MIVDIPVTFCDDFGPLWRNEITVDSFFCDARIQSWPTIACMIYN